jgi:hypothetical protein
MFKLQHTYKLQHVFILQHIVTTYCKAALFAHENVESNVLTLEHVLGI